MSDKTTPTPKGPNLQIAEFKERLVTTINESNLPISIVQLALFEVSAQVNAAAAQAIEAERQAAKKEE